MNTASIFIFYCQLNVYRAAFTKFNNSNFACLLMQINLYFIRKKQTKLEHLSYTMYKCLATEIKNVLDSLTDLFSYVIRLFTPCTWTGWTIGQNFLEMWQELRTDKNVQTHHTPPHSVQFFVDFKAGYTGLFNNSVPYQWENPRLLSIIQSLSEDGRRGPKSCDWFRTRLRSQRIWNDFNSYLRYFWR
jgi:hypothetical protein